MSSVASSRRSINAKAEIRPHGRPCKSLPELTLLGIQRLTTAGSLKTHLHPGQMEICYLQRGRITWWAGNDVVPLQGGDVYLTWPGEIHGGVDDISEPCRLCFLTVHVPRRPPAGFLRLPAKEAHTLCRRLHALPQRHFRGGEDLFWKFERMDSCIQNRENPLAVLEARATLVTLLADVVRYGEQTVQTMRLSPKVLESITIMERNLAAPLLLERIAESVRWSLSHFKARFRREVGESPAQYYLRLRVRGAVDAIRRNDTPLVQIALDFGFNSSQYLANCVKRITGKTPSSYRIS
ncbi:MAG: helix-turn-helix domain-containing protein [Phycisphaerae bacterium]|nr:helix-turn-helix domain-containing protein [Phycisphaerae bacterium]